MPAEFDNSNHSEQRSMAAWLSKMKSPLSQGEGLAKAMQKKVAESNMAQTPPTLVPSKACICAPTNHAGSFRCHLHRTTQQKPVEEDKKSSMKFGSKVMVDDGKPRLSRFGRAASARSPQKSESLAVE